MARLFKSPFLAIIRSLSRDDRKNIAPTVGFEPTTFGLEVQRASPLRHAGLSAAQKSK